MKLLEKGRASQIYVLQRFIEGWRVIYFDPRFIKQGGIFADVNWDDTSEWYAFSTKGQCYKDTGVPGTYSKQEALKAYRKLKSKLETLGAPVRLVSVDMTISVREVESCIPVELNVDPLKFEAARQEEKRRKKETEVPVALKVKPKQ